MYIPPGQGRQPTTLRGQNPNANRKASSLCPFVASFKKISLKSDFIHIFFMFLYMYIAPGQGQEQTALCGNFFFFFFFFFVNIYLMSLWSFAVSFFH